MITNCKRVVVGITFFIYNFKYPPKYGVCVVYKLQSFFSFLIFFFLILS